MPPWNSIAGNPLAGLYQAYTGNTDPRNQNLNLAYLPPWKQPGQFEPGGTMTNNVGVLQGDTRIDPFLGTPWGNMLDAAGASEPGGVQMSEGQGKGRMKGRGNVRPDIALAGLDKAYPDTSQPSYGFQTAADEFRKQLTRQSPYNFQV